MNKLGLFLDYFISRGFNNQLAAEGDEGIHEVGKLELWCLCLGQKLDEDGNVSRFVKELVDNFEGCLYKQGWKGMSHAYDGLVICKYLGLRVTVSEKKQSRRSRYWDLTVHSNQALHQFIDSCAYSIVYHWCMLVDRQIPSSCHRCDPKICQLWLLRRLFLPHNFQKRHETFSPAPPNVCCVCRAQVHNKSTPQSTAAQNQLPPNVPYAGTPSANPDAANSPSSSPYSFPSPPGSDVNRLANSFKPASNPSADDKVIHGCEAPRNPKSSPESTAEAPELILTPSSNIVDSNTSEADGSISDPNTSNPVASEDEWYCPLDWSRYEAGQRITALIQGDVSMTEMDKSAGPSPLERLSVNSEACFPPAENLMDSFPIDSTNLDIVDECDFPCIVDENFVNTYDGESMSPSSVDGNGSPGDQNTRVFTPEGSQGTEDPERNWSNRKSSFQQHQTPADRDGKTKSSGAESVEQLPTTHREERSKMIEVTYPSGRREETRMRAFCSQGCKYLFFIAANASIVRKRLTVRDREVCLDCGLNCSRIFTEYRKQCAKHADVQSLDDVEQTIATCCEIWAQVSPWSEECTKLVSKMIEAKLRSKGLRNEVNRKKYYGLRKGHLWQADHILPVKLGGGCSRTLFSYRTLCTGCHKVVTDFIRQHSFKLPTMQTCASDAKTTKPKTKRKRGRWYGKF